MISSNRHVHMVDSFLHGSDGMSSVSLCGACLVTRLPGGYLL
jgi:hypothetical protein